MDKWTVYVEVDGQEVWSATYGDLGSAQMMAEAKRLHYFYYEKALINVVVGIAQE
jgi:hypothetical protein